MTKRGGIEKLIANVAEFVAEEITGTIYEDATGDSEIERLLITALTARCRFSACEYIEAVIIKDESELETQQARALGHAMLFIEPQKQLPGWRVDFLIHGYDHGRPNRVLGRWPRTPGWRRLIVECDGHEYHERTKEQAARDRSRDREMQLEGYTVLRFTGSEIWRDPWACATQITDWAAWGL